VDDEGAHDGGHVFRRLPKERIEEAGSDALAVFLGNHVYAELEPEPAEPDPDPAADAVEDDPAGHPGIPWTLAFFQAVHRRLFERARPDIAGKLRDSRTAAGAAVVRYCNETIAFARGTEPSRERTDEIFVRAARFYASIVTAQLFERGNEYWGRQMVGTLLKACGFPLGTSFEIDRTQLDFEVLLVTMFDDPKPLGDTLLRGWLAQRRAFRMAAKE
jgi:Fic/DOC family protein